MSLLKPALLYMSFSPLHEKKLHVNRKKQIIFGFFWIYLLIHLTFTDLIVHHVKFFVNSNSFSFLFSFFFVVLHNFNMTF